MLESLLGKPGMCINSDSIFFFVWLILTLICSTHLKEHQLTGRYCFFWKKKIKTMGFLLNQMYTENWGNLLCGVVCSPECCKSMRWKPASSPAFCLSTFCNRMLVFFAASLLLFTPQGHAQSWFSFGTSFSIVLQHPTSLAGPALCWPADVWVSVLITVQHESTTRSFSSAAC